MADVERITPSSRDGDGTVRRRSSRSCTIIAQEKVAAAAAAAAAAASVTKSFLSSSALVKADSKTIQGETDQQKERRALRSMWELACVINFLNVFRSVVKIRTGFRADELETSLMNPNGLIKDLHIDLLKGIPPLPRVPIDKNNWAAVLCAKLRDRWSQVSDGVCPLMAAKGEEEAAYNALNAAARLRILRAVCEMRLDTDDVRGAMDETIKQGEPPSSFQLQPVAVDNSGCTYWYEDDETVGSRLYREIPPVLSKSKTRGLGRRAPPPAAPIWETIATNVEEFHEIGERLSNSRNKPEAKLGKYIFEDLLPCLEERERKREKAAKKQQRQQLLLQSIMNGVGLAAGRSRRERKIVSYTFEEFDKSINEAIKWTKCGLGLVVGVAAGGTSTPCNLVPFATPGVIRRGSADRNGHSAREVTQAERPKSRNVRPRVSSSQYGDQFVHIDEVEEEDEFGDDDIEGEAIYDDEYLEIRRRQLNALKMSTPVKRRAGRNGGLRRGPDSDDEDYKCGSIRARTGEQRRYNFRDGYSVHRLRQCSIVDDLQWGMKRSSRRRSGSEDENEGRPRGRNNRFLEDNNHHIAEARDFFGNGDFCDGELRGDEGGMQADSGDLSEDGYQSDGMTEDMGRRENGGAVLFEEDESTDAFEDRGRGVKRRRLADLSLGRNARERSRRVQVNHERAERGIFDTGSTRSSGRLNVLKGHITGPDRVACRTFEEVHYGYRLGEGVPRSNGTCDEMEEDGGAEEDYLERTEVRERDFAVGNSDSMQDDDGDSDEQGD